MYKYLLFDLDNTVLDFDLAEDIALTEFFKEQGVEDIAGYKAAYSPINKGLWHQLDLGEITREYLVENRFKKLFEHFGIEVDGKKLSKRYEEIIGQQGQHFDGAVELLDTLKEKGYKLYAATNGLTNIQTNRLNHSEITKYFDDIFISEQVGFQKPDIRFFEAVAASIPGFNKDEALMIGDNLFADIGGAQKFGIDTVWFNIKQKEKNCDVVATYTVTDFTTLLYIIED